MTQEDCLSPFAWESATGRCVLGFPTTDAERLPGEETFPPTPEDPPVVVTHTPKPKVKVRVPKLEVKMEEHVEVKAPEAAPVAASVSVPDGMPDLSAIIPKDGQISPMTAVMALIVVGGGIAFKFGPGFLKARAEQKMKELEIEEKKAENEKDSHEKCSVERMSLEAKLAALESKLAEVDAKASKAEGFDFSDLGLDDLKSRINKLEKAQKDQKVVAKKKGAK